MEQIQYLIPAAVITNSEYQILFLKKKTARTNICIDKWELPGGTIQFGENFYDALKRKVKDYLGIDVDPQEIIPYVHSYVTDGKIDDQPVQMQFHVIGVLCQIVGESEIELNQERISEFTWMNKEDFFNLPEDERVPGDAEILKALDL